MLAQNYIKYVEILLQMPKNSNLKLSNSHWMTKNQKVTVKKKKRRSNQIQHRVLKDKINPKEDKTSNSLSGERGEISALIINEEKCPYDFCY